MGVDYSSSNINISDNHATDILNLIKRNNVLQKRSGWKQIMSLEEDQTQLQNGNNINFEEDAKFNGIWNARYKNQNIVIAHIGTKFYFVNNIESDDFEKINLKEIATPEGITINNEKSWGIVANDRLYVLCGSYIVIKLETETMTRVYNDEDTYVPTTTIGITPSEIPSNIQRTSYDDVNLLSPYRINTFLSIESTDSQINEYTYILDSPMECSAYGGGYLLVGEFEITINYLNDYNAPEEINVKIKNGASSSGIVGNETGRYFSWNIYNGPGTEENIIGYLGIGSQYTVVVLKKYYKPLIEGKDNITVKFIDDRENESDLIDGCKFGVLYGANNNRNRLFIAGNPKTPNTDYHNSQRNIYANDNDIDLLDNQDYTYFSVKDYCNYGTTNSKVMGYQIMGDGTLLVMKEKIDNEPTVYFRRGVYETFNSYIGEDSITLQRETYPMYVGNIGEGLVIENGLFNLNNDIVFLSKNGLFGISSGITASSLNSDYRYAYSRSRLINKKLLNYDLSKAKMVMYDNKLFITLKDENENKYITYVADGRYRLKLEDSIDNEYEYEWFVLEDINADSFYIINNKLYFSNNSGLYYWNLNSEEYLDTNYAKTINSGTISVDSNNPSKIVISKDFEKKYINETTILKFEKESKILLFKLESSIVPIDNNWYTIEDNFIINKFHASITGQTCYFTNNQNEEIEYTLNVDPNNRNQIQFIKDNKAQKIDFTSFKNNRYEFYFKVNNLDGYKYKIYIEGNNYYLLGENDEKLQFYDSIGNLSLYLKNTKPIKAYYITKSFNFGQSIYTKVLRTLSITNDTDLYSKVNFALFTEDAITLNKEIIKIDSQYNSATNGISDLYKNIFKADLTSRTFKNSFTKDFLLKFNYIQFAFYNTDEENCVINNLTVVYTFGFKKKGV